MLVLLKIPVVYLCMVVWWAIRAEPGDDRPAVAARVTDTPLPGTPAPPSARPPRLPRDGRRADDRRGARSRAAQRPRPVRGEAR